MLFQNGLRACANMIASGMALLAANGGIAAIPLAPLLSEADRWSDADVADLFAAAPVILRAKIVSAAVVKGAAVAPGTVRYYVKGQVTALIRGPQAVPPRLSWLVDMRPDSRGKLPKLNKADVLVAALPVAGRPGEIRLAARDAQVFWTPAIEARVRALVANVAAPDAPPAISAIVSAFHTAGTIPGEGETQIFLSTVTREPVSISILSRPGQAKRWAVALGEIVDEAAAPPAPGTLGWYRLACFLPPTLPDAAIAALPSEESRSAQADYDFVLRTLGPCTRVRR